MKFKHTIKNNVIPILLVSLSTIQSNDALSQCRILTSYDVQTAEFSGFQNADAIKQLGELEIIDTRRVDETKHIEICLDYEGNYTHTTNVLVSNDGQSYFTKIGKIVIDNQKTTTYDRQGNVFMTLPHDDKTKIATDMQISNYAQKKPLENFTFKQLGETELTQMSNNGFAIERLSDGAYAFSKDNIKIIYNANTLTRETQWFEHNEKKRSIKQVFKRNVNGDIVPLIRTEITYENTPQTGTCVQHVKQENYSNFTYRGDNQQGIKQKEAIGLGKISLFPNPADYFLYLKFEDIIPSTAPEENISICISDVLSKPVLTVEQVQDREVGIDISGFTAGVYFVKVTKANGVSQTLKFVKQ